MTDERADQTRFAQHTRLPNWLLDYVLFRLRGSEQACLLYIIRKTWGWTSPGTAAGERKRLDRISLNQFVNGQSGRSHVFDIGTGLTRSTVIAALKELEELGLVQVLHDCPKVPRGDGEQRREVGCGWSEDPQAPGGYPSETTKKGAPRCPTCKRTLAKSYAPAILTPMKVKRFLNATDTDGNKWDYDARTGYFRILTSGDPEPKAEPDIPALRDQLMFPDKVDKITSDIISTRVGRKIANSFLVNQILVPVIAMQEEFGRNATRYALDEVIERRKATEPGNHAWHRYARAIAKNQLGRQHGTVEAGKAANVAADLDAELDRCAELNGIGDTDTARSLLETLLAPEQLEAAAALLDGDRALARRSIREAFKRGYSDWRNVRDYGAFADYLPEWNWEDDERNISDTAYTAGEDKTPPVTHD